MSDSTEIQPMSGGDGELIPDPGIPPHEHRLTDTDPKAAKRAERQVATMFGIAALASLAAAVFYLVLPLDGTLSRLQASNFAIGLSLGLAIFLIGAAAIHWAKKLMPDVEVVQERHDLAPTPEAQQEALAAFNAGVEESGFGRRTLIRNSMLGAFAMLPLPALILLGDLGDLTDAPQKKAETIWAKGVRVVNDVTFTPIRPEDVRLGAIINAMPETYLDIPEEQHAEALVQRGKSSVIVVRMEPADMDEATAAAAIDGIACYSKICTHVGCPLSLWERTTNNMLCPCHQSTFNLAQGGKAIFGPARRPLPQLALEVDADGYLAAQGDFPDPVGPSFWERERV